jgi:UDP-N-acetylmuramoyl-L-alanyl-D-glutamate--2,6-diaminopimelate ligase
MIGEFNAYNLLCVYGAAVELGEPKQTVLQVLSTLTGAEGRFEYLFSAKENIMGIIDYAHTPDALLNVLATINKLRTGTETLFTIIGCGGNRDKTKRPLMATVACEHSDRVLLTSDNPRNEEPMQIIREMESGVPVNHRRKYVCIADRKEAIKTACSIAEFGDIILVAGKGHEKYQEIEGVKYPFDDKIVLQEMFNLFEK